LFDENQNTADVSHRVSSFVDQIGRETVNNPSDQQISKLKKSVSKK
jgi:hypothetical protein